MPRRVTPETAVKHEIKRWLGLFGWECWSNLQGLGAHKGVPDIEAIKRVNGRSVTLYIEVKSMKGVQSEYQKQFQQMIERNGGYYILARSSLDVERYLIRAGIEKNRRLI